MAALRAASSDGDGDSVTRARACELGRIVNWDVDIQVDGIASLFMLVTKCDATCP
jgi:hypothetical protein